MHLSLYGVNSWQPCVVADENTFSDVQWASRILFMACGIAHHACTSAVLNTIIPSRGQFPNFPISQFPFSCRIFVVRSFSRVSLTPYSSCLSILCCPNKINKYIYCNYKSCVLHFSLHPAKSSWAHWTMVSPGLSVWGSIPQMYLCSTLVSHLVLSL